MNRRILYLQYTNPAGYPPLEHGSRILAERGWTARFLASGSVGTRDLRFPELSGRATRTLPRCPVRALRPLHHFLFTAWAVLTALAWRPAWVYASDPLSSPAGWALSLLGFRVVYHEHDLPAPSGAPLARLGFFFRKKLARRAALCVVPNEGRARLLRESTGASRVAVVWNCPAAGEAGTPRSARSSGLRVLYQGSIVPERVPEALLEALARLPENVSLTVLGYVTQGGPDYGARLRDRARALGVASRFALEGPRDRARVVEACRAADVGLALLPRESADANLRSMMGASNKAFEYLACGSAVLVPDFPEWRAAFVEPGYGLACDPGSAESIASALRRFLESPEETRRMGEKGREKVLRDWNYEKCFAPVVEALEAGRAR